MKIEPGNQMVKPGQANRAAQKAAGNGGFRKIYQQTVAGRFLRPAEPGKVQGGFKPAPPPGVCPADRQDQTGVLGKLEEAIDGLEKYRLCLADPASSLKQAAGYLEQAGRAVEELSMTPECHGADAALGDLVQEVLTTIVMEKTRFQRGDYL